MIHNHYEDNVFTKILNGDLPAIKVFEDEKTFVMMDIMPQTKGHLLVLPKQKAVNFFDISSDYLQACIDTAKKVAPALMAATQADGMVLTQFNGSTAGQTVFHIHFHLIPTYKDQSLKGHGREQADQEQLKALAQEIIKNLDA
ncbi:HIT family protein [Brackiella oedipodis]|uniref:HIT family protein n=1 Tax=Brackiella oedipodis TaxID=124225 RepID=UPI00048DA8E2|nr:HIT domain-containing protein [Brackiella oedipodis]